MAVFKGQAVALMIGILAGLAFYRLGTPLPWMLGPMIANTVAALLGAPIDAPVRLRPFVIPVIGVMLGASITAEVFGLLGTWAKTLLMMFPFLAVAAAASFSVYRRIGKYDPVTAYFASMPGGLNEMLTLGEAAGGDERRIATAHATRILVVIAFVGLFFGYVLDVRAGGSGGRPWIALDALAVSDWFALAACAVLGSLLGKRLMLPAPVMLGPMLLSAIAHLTHLVEVSPPTLIVVGAQIVLGTVIGCRFRGTQLRQIGFDLWLGLWSALSMLVVAVAFAALTAKLTGTPMAQVFLAFSPGGLTEMSLLALAMGQDVAFVSVMHILRILLVIIAAPVAFRVMGSRRA